MNIVNVGYDSTNYYVLADKTPRLLIDVGFPNTLSKLEHQCKRMGIKLTDIKHLLATHYHPDHAGLVPELQRIGCKLIVMENQLSAVPELAKHLKPHEQFTGIDLKNALTLTLADSRAFLARLGITGEIIATPGHSDDSVTLVLDEGAAFTGDLTHPLVMGEDAPQALHDSWTRLRALGVTTIYGGHGPTWRLA